MITFTAVCTQLLTQHLYPGSGPWCLAVFKFPPFCRVAWVYGDVLLTHKIVNRDTHVHTDVISPQVQIRLLNRAATCVWQLAHEACSVDSLEMGHTVHAHCAVTSASAAKSTEYMLTC